MSIMVFSDLSSDAPSLTMRNAAASSIRPSSMKCCFNMSGRGLFVLESHISAVVNFRPGGNGTLFITRSVVGSFWLLFDIVGLTRSSFATMMWCYAGTAGAGCSTLVVFDTYPVVVSALCVASTGHRHTACTIKRVTSLIFFYPADFLSSFFFINFKVHTYRPSLAGRIIAGHRDGFVRVYYYCCDGHSSNSSGYGGGGGVDGGGSRRARRGGGGSGDGDVGRFLFSVNYCTRTDDDDDDDDPAASARFVTMAIVVVVVSR